MTSGPCQVPGDGMSDMCGPFDARDRRRVRFDLEGGHMDICLSPDASPETVAALRSIGQAAVNHMRKEQSMATRAKFICTQTTQYTGSSKQAVLTAVTDDGNPENKAFWAATPSGRIEINISNPDAAEQFEAGKSYYVDFTPAEAAEA